MQDRATLSRLVVALLGHAPDAITPTSSPDAWGIVVAERRLVVKFSPPTCAGSVLVEAWAYRECRRHGVRVPEVLAVSDAPECIIVETLCGSSLWAAGHPQDHDRVVWRRVGEDMRVMHAIRLHGFGPLIMGLNGTPHGEADRWSPFVSYAREHGIAHLARTGYLDLPTAQHFEERYDNAASLINTCTDGRLLHGDLEGGHLFATDEGEYTGLIDFGLAQSGDPRWDLARVLLWDGPAALDALLDGYGRDAVTDEDREVVLPLYLLAFVIHQAVLFDRSGRYAAAREHIEQVGALLRQ